MTVFVYKIFYTLNIYIDKIAFVYIVCKKFTRLQTIYREAFPMTTPLVTCTPFQTRLIPITQILPKVNLRRVSFTKLFIQPLAVAFAESKSNVYLIVKFSLSYLPN